jgi:hypothetical protein
VDAVGGLRAAALLRESFGDLSEAHDVLVRLAGMLARLDEEERADTKADEAARAGTATKTSVQGARKRQ